MQISSIVVFFVTVAVIVYLPKKQQKKKKKRGKSLVQAQEETPGTEGKHKLGKVLWRSPLVNKEAIKSSFCNAGADDSHK